MEFSQGNPDHLHLILTVISLVLAVAYMVMWRQSKKAQSGSKAAKKDGLAARLGRAR